jgi:3-hydroxybutyryl-CoA dehydrogenase
MNNVSTINSIGIIGAGTMGVGVAADLILHGINAVLVDQDPEQLQRAEAEINKTVRFAPMMKEGLTPIARSEARNRLSFHNDLTAVKDCDFIIENVSENRETKESIHRTLDKICQPEVCFGINTSCLSITQLAAVTGRPERIVGIHFMNPVFLKSVVEVMKGVHTSEATLDRVRDLLQQLNKESIVVEDFPGFVSNRISHLFMNEAMWVAQDKVATHEQIDQIFKQCFGHKMGPLETADLIGLDVVRDSLKVLYDSYQDSKFRCCPLLQRKVDAGELGRKSGQGFFSYQQD